MCNAIRPSVPITVPRGAVKTWPPVPRMVTHPHKTATVSQLGWGPDFLGRTTTGGHGLFAAHTRHSTSTTRSWPGGRNALGHASGSWRWTAAHTSAPSARVNWSPSRMSLSTGLGRRAVRTYSPCPRRSPGPSRSPGLEFPGGRFESWGLVAGGYRDVVHRNLPPVDHLVSIFSIPGSCCTRVTGLFVAAFPRTPTLALVLAQGMPAALARLGAPLRRLYVCSLQCFCSASGSTSSGGSASLTH